MVLEINPGIRDADLVETYATSFVKDLVLPRLQDEQRRRDSLAAMSPVQRRRAVTGHKLKEDAVAGHDRADLGHIHSVLAMCALPHSRPTERTWERKQGKMSLKVTAGQLMSPDGQWVDQPLPWGSRARLIMLHTCSQAVLQKSPTIEIEDTLSEFIRSLGLKVTGGKNGTLTYFKAAVCSLAACSMKIGLFDGDKARTINTQPYSSMDVWFSPDPRQKSLWPSKVTFSKDFYDTLTKHALPVNMHTVRAFANSSRKLDLIYWIGYRMFSLSDKPLHLKWQQLQDQFGADYSRKNNFKRDFAKEVSQIREVLPKLPFTLTENGATLFPGDTKDLLCLPANPRK